MRIDGITVSVYDDKTEDSYEVVLWYDSGNDIYPTDIEITDKIQQQILEIRKVAFG